MFLGIVLVVAAIVDQKLPLFLLTKLICQNSGNRQHSVVMGGTL